MAPNWQDEVREIVERADGWSARSTRGPAPRRTARPAPASPFVAFERIGAWIGARVATPTEMLVTAASLVVIALLASVVLRPAASIFAIVGAILFLAALGRGIAERRWGRAGGHAVRPTTWRGQVIELRAQRRSLGDRLQAFWRRCR